MSELPLTVSNLDEVPEAARPLYKENGDGFKLPVDLSGYESAESVQGLRSALEKERDGRKSDRQTAAELREKLEALGDLSPDEVKRLREAENRLKSHEAGGDPDQVEELLGKRTEELRTRHESELKQRDSKIGDLTERLTDVESRYHRTVIDHDLRAAASGLEGFRPEAIEDLLLLARNTWKLNESEKPTAYEVIDGRETPITTADGPVSMKDWIKGLRERRPHWFEPVQGSGGGHDEGGDATGTAAERKWKGRKRSELSQAEKVQAVRELGNHEKYMELTVS